MAGVQAGLFLAGYTLVLAVPASIVTWGFLQRPGGYVQRLATYLAVTAGVVLVAPPWVGFAIDVYESDACNGSRECYEYVRWWFAVPLGWVLGLGVVLGAFIWNRDVEPGGGAN